MIDTRRLDAAVSGVLSASIKDCRRGAITRDELEEFARRRANGIRASYLASAAVAAAAPCAGCARAVKAEDAASIGGMLYCKGCAPRFRKPVPARRAA